MAQLSASSLRGSIEAHSRRLGFELFGVTTPEPPPHVQVYEDWINAGRHGEMAYLASERARTRRSNPKQILPECSSILVLGARYYSPSQTGPSSLRSPASGNTPRVQALRGANEDIPVEAQTNYGKVASYAWGYDYHEILAKRMNALVGYIETLLGKSVAQRNYSDTGAILERDLAQRAGLGWIGKNTCLIQPQNGSYYLLSEILLDLALPPDPPFSHDRCGNCRRCLDACPTGCILPDRTLDSRRCISYLTIELKGNIPQDLRPLVGNWVFGCDICQQVCPWNHRFAALEGDPAFAPRPGLPNPNLIEDLSLTPEAFNRKFKDSPVRRAKRRGYLRNVCVALGNHGDKKAIPVLTRALQVEPEALVRSHAAWALGKIGSQEALQALAQARLSESCNDVLEEMQAALDA